MANIKQEGTEQICTVSFNDSIRYEEVLQECLPLSERGVGWEEFCLCYNTPALKGVEKLKLTFLCNHGYLLAS
jgi:hypothetical protein